MLLKGGTNPFVVWTGLRQGVYIISLRVIVDDVHKEKIDVLKL